MEIPLFLAMTAAELKSAAPLSEHIAWMACHFSPYHTALSNLPHELPKDSMLMLNDRTPPAGHDPKAVADSLTQTAQALECSCILLDFQRPGNEETASIVEAVLQHSECPVGVSCCYGEKLDCPLLLPPIPPHIDPEEICAPWQGRELWLEMAWEGTQITVSRDGSTYAPLPYYTPDSNSHRDRKLHCHYDISPNTEQIIFRLGRTEDDRQKLLEEVSAMGVTKAIGLWQEWAQHSRERKSVFCSQDISKDTLYSPADKPDQTTW